MTPDPPRMWRATARRDAFRWSIALVAACATFALAATDTATAAVHVNPLFTDHAVLQRDRPVPVWGTADAGEPVTVQLDDRSVSTAADEGGRWSLTLPAMPASEVPAKLTVRGKRGTPKVELTDILIGDVWLCGGQSNMERQLGPRPPQPPIDRWEDEVAAATYPTLRLLTVAQGGSATPRAEAAVGPGWSACTPATAKQFSAVGYFFGRDLQATLKVPIGLIHSSVGGTPIAAWTSREALAASPEFAAMAGTKGAGSLFNGMIAPLAPYGLRGAIWYQGESDAKPTAQAERYRRLLPLMVADWRSHGGELPFLVVQVAPFKDMPPMIRESQRVAVAHMPRSALVVTTDAGEAGNIHPPHKQVVGERLALAARAGAYGERVEYSGPAFKSLAVTGADVAVTFDHVGKGLVAREGSLRGFELAGADGAFHPATATIRGEAIVARADGVPEPKSVRFGWAPVPDLNLFNGDGLPASPFTAP